MLLNKLFTVLSQEATPGNLKCTIAFNTDHEIFSGHFPGLPVVPGVCMVQMVKEIFQCVQPGRYNLASADNIKFLAVLNPAEQDEIQVLLNYDVSMSGSINVQASIFAGTLTFLKMKATLKPVA